MTQTTWGTRAMMTQTRRKREVRMLRVHKKTRMKKVTKRNVMIKWKQSKY